MAEDWGKSITKTPPESPEEKKRGEVIYQESYSGLLPHPRLIREWEQIVPGSAERIVTQFEKQFEHRITIESQVISARNFKEYTGPVFGFIIAMTTIIGGIWTALAGLPFLGGSLSFTGFAVLVGAFLLNRQPSRNQDKQ